MAKVVKVAGNIPTDLKIHNGASFLFISRDQRACTHGLHKYPAKFFPELPRWIIERYSDIDDTVLDPFTGSGTTNVEASLLNRHRRYVLTCAALKVSLLALQPLTKEYRNNGCYYINSRRSGSLTTSLIC